MITPPWTTEEYLNAVAPTFAMDVNAVREHDKPRASGLGSCARQQGYMMAGFHHEEYGGEGSARAVDNTLTAEQGRMFEGLSIAIISRLGFEITSQQMCVGHEKCTEESEQGPVDFPVSGHPDGGRIIRSVGPMGQPWTDKLGEDGLVWGWEHKHLGRWAYEAILKRGLMKAEPGFVVQSGMYGRALGWDASYFTVVAQDGSSVRGDMTANLRAKNPAVRWATRTDINPKVHHEVLDLRPLQGGLIDQALYRADWLSAWKAKDGDPANIAREADPMVRETKWVRDGEGGRMEIEQAVFPCSYCPYLNQCIKDGPGGYAAPTLPWTNIEEDTGDPA